MDLIQIAQEVLPFHGWLGRNFRRDSRSLAFPVNVDGAQLKTTWWQRHVGPFDQGNTGSCTGNAGEGNMVTSPFFETMTPTSLYPGTEDGAVALYSKATQLDTYPGQYPPDDTGSDGLAVAAALKQAGMISGYTHAFDGPTARLALTKAPGIVGVKWYDGMFSTTGDGEVKISGSLAGGHEISADGIDVENRRVWMTQSWGPSWGVTRDGIPGRFWMSFETFDSLMADGGDFVQFVPVTQPAPTPTPVPVPPVPAAVGDQELWDGGARDFAHERHVLHAYVHLAALLRGWGAGKSFQ